MAMQVCEGVADVETWQPPRKNSTEYRRIHRRVKEVRGLARRYRCIQCGEQARTWAWQHGADPMTIYSYEPMCYSCHTLYDMTDNTRAKISAFMQGRQHAAGNTHNRGEGNGRAKLTTADVHSIRAGYAHGLTLDQLAVQYGLHPKSVGQIVRRDRWRHI